MCRDRLPVPAFFAPRGLVCLEDRCVLSLEERGVNTGGAEQRGAMKFGKGLMARLIWCCPAKRTKKLPEAGKNPPKNFKKGLDTHGAVLYDNGAPKGAQSAMMWEIAQK